MGASDNRTWSGDLCIVATHRKDLYHVLRKEFADNENIKMILDRRHGERRAFRRATEEDRRRNQRRVSDESYLLNTLGVVFVSRAHVERVAHEDGS
jgi:hypothetical protein